MSTLQKIGFKVNMTTFMQWLVKKQILLCNGLLKLAIYKRIQKVRPNTVFAEKTPFSFYISFIKANVPL